MNSHYIRHVVEHKHPNRHSRRSEAAQARHQGDTPHGLGTRRPRGWRQARKRARKAAAQSRRVNR